MVSFCVNTKQLFQTLKLLKAGLPERKANALKTQCELTIKTAEVIFDIPGCVSSVKCSTVGTAKATVLFLHFYEIIKVEKDPETKIQINNGNIKINQIAINAKTCFFEDDSILRTVDLPVNYIDKELLLLSQRHTPEELAFNKMTPFIKAAEKKLEENINGAYKKLRIYGVSMEEIKALVNQKIKDTGYRGSEDC